MDCLDRHNRAAHSFDTAEDALNKDMALGSPSPSLSFVHKEGLALIKAKYTSEDAAKTSITSGLLTFYQSHYPAIWNGQQAQVKQAAETLATIYSTNIFPFMNVSWGTHPNHLGHNDYPGCFRCHDGNHTAKSGASTPIPPFQFGLCVSSSSEMESSFTAHCTFCTQERRFLRDWL